MCPLDKRRTASPVKSQGLPSTGFSRRTGVVLLCLAVMAVAWAVWCAHFLPWGVDFTDEGLYCADAWRFEQGDVVSYEHVEDGTFVHARVGAELHTALGLT